MIYEERLLYTFTDIPVERSGIHLSKEKLKGTGGSNTGYKKRSDQMYYEDTVL